MAEWLIYGKRTEPWWDSHNKMRKPDKTFRALDAKGIRVNKLEDAMSYATKEDAEEVIAKKGTKKGVILEVRRAK